jgi:hypothetical protein
MAAPASSTVTRYSANDARKLLGTIYLPNGVLYIDANKPIADQSAYTIVVARRVELYSGPNLVLNTDYGGTDVPIPKGAHRQRHPLRRPAEDRSKQSATNILSGRRHLRRPSQARRGSGFVQSREPNPQRVKTDGCRYYWHCGMRTATIRVRHPPGEVLA